MHRHRPRQGTLFARRDLSAIIASRVFSLLLAAAMLIATLPIPGIGGERAAPVRPVEVPPAHQTPAAQTPEPQTFPGPVDHYDPAFIQQMDLGNGEQAVIFSATPLFYTAADGSPQPIDARFEPGEWGFANLRNLVAIGADSRRAGMRVALGGLTVDWRPDALLAATGEEDTLLARPLADLPEEGAILVADGQAIRYPESWSMPGLADEIVALPGGAEHNVLFTQPPPVDGAERLILRAYLRLPPGAQVWADNQPRLAPFETDGDVVIHPADGGAPLILTPAYIFEAANPAAGIVAGYRFEPVADGWLVAMSTPAAWWQDPARSYPVIWDPKIQTLRPVEFAQRTSAGCNPLGGYLLVGRFQYQDGPWTISCQYRALLRFNNLSQLTLPPGAAIERATLVVVPDGGFVNVRYNSFKEITLNGEVRPATSAWANNASVGWDNNPSVGAAIGPAQRYSRYASSVSGPFSRYFEGMRFPIQEGANGLVTNWINGNANHGLELRAIPGQESACTNGCNYVTIPRGTAWSQFDKNFNLDYDSPLGGIYDAPGVALVIQYRGPTLPEGQAFRLDDNAPLPPVPGDNNFNRTFHAYNLQPSNGARWTAVGVKGLRRSVFDAGGLEMTGWFSHAAWGALEEEMVTAAGGDAPAASQQAFELPLSLALCDTCSDHPSSRSPGEPRQGSNFVLMAGSVADGAQVRVHPPKADPKLERYAVEVVRSTPLSPPVDLAQVQAEGFYQEYSFTVSTDHLLALRSVNLPANSNVLLRMEADYSTYNTAPVVARLFAPGKDIYHKSRAVRIIDDGQPGQSFPVQANMGGEWAVVIDLPGDVTPVRMSEGYCDDQLVECTNPPIRTLTVTLKLLVCPINADAKESGCKFHYQPVPGVTPHREVRVGTLGFYRIYQPDGFVNCATDFSGRPGDECTPVNTKWVSYITWRDSGHSLERMVAVSGGRVRINDTAANRRLLAEHVSTGTGLEYPTLSLGKRSGDPANPIFPRQVIWVGSTSASITVPTIGAHICNNSCPDLPLNGPDARAYQDGKFLDFTINVRSQIATGQGRMSRPIKLADGSMSRLNLDVSWQVQAEGYRGKETAPPGATGPTALTATAVGGAGPIRIAAMTYWFSNNYDVYYDPNVGYFTTIRNDNGRIHQDINLGGAWTRVDFLILPFGVSPDGGDGVQLCGETGGFCGDIRDATDTWAQPRRTWRMPDILVTGNAQTLVYRADGQVQVFSTDHPSAGLEAANTSVGFSYKSFGARVEITDEVCPGSSNPERVQVIKGSSKIKLPGIGSEVDSSLAIDSSFILCEGKLRRVSLKFDAYPTGIPLAQPPVMYLNSIAGTVTIDPAYTVIEIEVGFFIGDPASPVKLYKGTGTVTIDTRGLFDMQTTGKILGMMDAEGRLWVAWNPLDVGMGAAGWLPSKNDWLLQGFYYAHVWRGQGWQGRYHWLPNDNAFHMTASLQAQFRIPEGQIIDTWPIVIPPGEVRIGVELSFGQFCANANCTQYQWGIKGVIKIAGFSVGAYVNLECDLLMAAAIAPPLVLLCTKFIIGSDGHVLIDQYGGGGPPFPRDGTESAATRLLSVGGERALLNYRTVADPMAAAVDEPLLVNPSTESFMVALGWVRGGPELSLLNPNGIRITPANALEHGVVISATANMLLFGVSAPLPGQWTARVENATPEDDYRILFLANKAAPMLNFTRPVAMDLVSATGDGTTAQPYRITWTPPEDSANLHLSLYYEVSNGTALSENQRAGGVIVERIDPALGFYDWDLAFHSRGEYQIYATLQDRSGANVSPTGGEQYVGVTRSDAPGTLVYTDILAPPPIDPDSVTFSPLEGGMKMCWAVSPARDLMGYVVRYHVFGDPNTGAFGRVFTERALADVAYSPDARQCMRIGGLEVGASSVAFPGQGYGVAVFDVNLNESVVARPASGMALQVPVDETQPISLTLSGAANPDGSVTLTWPITNASRYELFYAVETPAGPGQPGSGAGGDDSPIVLDDLTFTGSYTLHGLTPGRWHAFAVRWYAQGLPFAPPSHLSSQLWLRVSASGASGSDLCPDDWYAAHGLTSSDGDGDADRDGLSNRIECALGTHPLYPDTDGDGWSDGDEVFHGTDPLDPLSRPQVSAQGEPPAPRPRLGLTAHSLHFHAFTQGGNPPSQSVGILNLGGGSLTASAAADVAWIQPSVVGQSLVVSLNKSGLPRGEHTGTVTVTAGGDAGGSPQQVTVTVQILAGSPAGASQIYLPAVAGGAGPPAAPDWVIYDDGLAPGWQNWSWSSSVNLANTAPVHSGSRSIGVQYNAAWAGFSVRTATPIDTAAYSAVTLWVYGAPGGSLLDLYTQAADEGMVSPLHSFTAPAGVWTQITVPLSNLSNPARIARINIQDRSGAPQALFYIDDLRLTGR